MARVISFVGCAPGVGVTTTVQALACALRQDHKSVQCIDTTKHATPQTPANTENATRRQTIEALISKHQSDDYILIDTDATSALLVTQLGHPVIVIGSPDPNHLHQLTNHATIHASGTSPLLGLVIVRTTDEETPQTRKAMSTVIDLQLRNCCRVLNATIGDNGPEARRFRRDNYSSIAGPLEHDWFALSDELTDLAAILSEHIAKTSEARGAVGCPIGINNLTIETQQHAETEPATPTKIRKSFYLPEDLIKHVKKKDAPVGDQIIEALSKHRTRLLTAPLPKPNHDTVPHDRIRAYLTDDISNEIDELAENMDGKPSHLVAQALRLELGSR